MDDSCLKSLTSSTVHIAISPWDLTDDYNRHAGVTLLSLLEHCSQPVTVHLLYDAKLSIEKEKEEAYTKSCYQKICQKYNAELEFHHVDLPEWMGMMPATKRFSVGTLLRLYLPDLIPEINKIIYLDCDMVVLTDMAELWKIDLQDKYLAACLDEGLLSQGKRTKRYWTKKNIPSETYFNAGLLVLNLEKFRSEIPSYLESVLTYLRENLDLKWLDQDALNWYCRDNYIQIDAKYNQFLILKDKMLFNENGVIHYTLGYQKPWKKYNGFVDDYYWEYLIKTPWCDDINKLVWYVRASPDVKKTMNLLSSDFAAYAAEGGILKTLSIAIGFTLRLWKNIFLKGCMLIYRRVFS